MFGECLAKMESEPLPLFNPLGCHVSNDVACGRLGLTVTTRNNIHRPAFYLKLIISETG
jgi:hypothetical protein